MFFFTFIFLNLLLLIDYYITTITEEDKKHIELLKKTVNNFSFHSLFSILKLMDFFNNEMFNIQIITYIIIPELNSNIAIDLIIFSYDKLCYFSETGKDVDNAYFELFYQCLEELSSNENVIIKNIEMK